MSKKCPKSVPRVSPDGLGHLFDTPATLSGHFLDTPEPGARRGPGDTPRDTRGTLRARRARETPVAGRGVRKTFPPEDPFLEVPEMTSAKTASAILSVSTMCGRRCVVDSEIIQFRISFPFGENSAGFCKSVWLPGSILNFRIGSVSSIAGLTAVTLFVATVSDFQIFETFWKSQAQRLL